MIAIIDYKAGNAPSVLHATRRIGVKATMAKSTQEVQEASHIILPGVGNARPTMQSLYESELIEAIENAVLREKRYFLGICIGMQILFEHSEEEDTDCLGWLKGQVVRFDSSVLRVPQMGWNKVDFVKTPSVKAQTSHFYFVNSYHAVPEDSTDTWGVANYGGAFTAAAHRENIYATQFHVEKSGEAGLAILKSFCNLKEGAKC